jgi:hypothetical protein
MLDHEVEEYVKSLATKKQQTEDEVLLFLLKRLDLNAVEVKETQLVVQEDQKRLAMSQSKQTGLIATRTAYLEDMRERVRDLEKTETEGEQNVTE